MNTASDKAYIEQLIASKRSAIRYDSLFAVGVSVCDWNPIDGHYPFNKPELPGLPLLRKATDI